MKPTLFQEALSHIALFLLSERMTLDRNISWLNKDVSRSIMSLNRFSIRSFLLSQKILAILNFSCDPDKFEMNFQFFRKLIFVRNGAIILDDIRILSVEICVKAKLFNSDNCNLWYSLLNRILYFFYFEDFLIIKLSNSQHSMIFDDTLTNALQEFQISSRR